MKKKLLALLLCLALSLSLSACGSSHTTGVMLSLIHIYLLPSIYETRGIRKKANPSQTALEEVCAFC